MSEPRLLSSPAVVLFSGVLMAVLWAGGLNFVWELSSAQIVHVLTTGAMGAVGASIGSLLLAVAARTAQNRFDEAEQSFRRVIALSTRFQPGCARSGASC